MNSSSAPLSAELGLRLVVPEHVAVPLVASLYYSNDDPYAIRMAFHVGLDEQVEWIFARDLLAAGMSQRSGDGDVQVWPATDGDRDLLNIALSSPFGQALFEAPSAAIAGFLRRTYEAVPDGEEGGFIDIEGELGDLFWRA